MVQLQLRMDKVKVPRDSTMVAIIKVSKIRVIVLDMVEVVVIVAEVEVVVDLVVEVDAKIVLETMSSDVSTAFDANLQNTE